MKFPLLYYKPTIQNFGDFLNDLLEKENGYKDFPCPTIGMGSILDEDFLGKNQLLSKEILCLGSGCRKPADLPDTKFHNDSFVRGPLSKKALKNRVKYITDGAYLLKSSFDKQNLLTSEKIHEVSLVPYFRSFGYFNWDKIEKQTGIKIIDPRSPKGHWSTIREIAKSKIVIAEAMHGAIVADILRVPWVQLDFLASSFENRMVSRFKWQDWQQSLELGDCEPIDAATYHKSVANTNNYRLKHLILHGTRPLNQKKLIKALLLFKKNPYTYLSPDLRFKQVLEELEETRRRIL